LFVALEGETQGNDYQDTLAQLKMNFAVELVKTTPVTPDAPEKEPVKVVYTIVQTGDNSQVILFSVLALVSGIGLLFAALGMMKKRQDEKGELQG